MYKEKEVVGMLSMVDNHNSNDKIHAVMGKVTVRMTNDDKGATLSLQFHDIQITIPAEELAGVFKAVHYEL